MAYDPTDVERVKRALSDPRDVCHRLELDAGAKHQQHGLVVRCPAHADEHPSCSVQNLGHGSLVKCHACGFHGDVLHLVAATLRLDARRRTEFAEVMRRAAALAGVDLEHRRQPRPLPSRPAVPKVPPPTREVRALWNACRPCAADAAVAAWLRSRAVDPALVDRLGLARALPVGLTGWRWASYRGQAATPAPWAALGYRVVVTMYDATGALRSVRARYIGPPRDDVPKALPPSGHSCKGLVMACPVGALMLAVGSWPWWAERRVVVTEGEPDFLTWATRGEIPRRLAVLGVAGSGQWTEALANRIPDGAVVLLRTDPDDAGDAYAAEIVATLRGRCRARESDPDGRAQRRRTKAEREAARRARPVQPTIPVVVP